MKKITKTEKETIALAKKLAQSFVGGEVVGLIGDLGAGKTIFTKGIASGLGIKNNINSPTFVLMKVYPIKKGSIKNFVHIDAYRINNYKDLEVIGADEYFNDPKSLVVVEWADRVKLKSKIKKAKLIYLTNKGEHSRLIEF
ncbi:MAG: tRNA (adenosine(37)-N6)-threonylcarbamoyltransferase complex ATPase subunit type 1 TsaE [bacterium]